MLPKRTAAALAATDVSKLPGTLATDLECEGAKFHSPRPLLLHRMPLATGGYAWLCGTCVDNLTVYQHLQEHSGGTVPWDLAREFGTRLRLLGDGRRRKAEKL